MSARLTLVSASSTSATAASAFATDEPLDARGAAWAAQYRGRLSRVTRAWCSPARSCGQTAAALGLETQPEPLLRDWDLGRWQGRALDDVAAQEPEAVGSWLADPVGSPHGGEALTELITRVATWLCEVPGDGHTVVVTHAAVIRAAILSTVAGAPQGFWRIDIAPLTVTVLRGEPGRWTLRSAGHPLATPDPH